MSEAPILEAPPERRDYTIILEVTPQTALTHGDGNDGNEQRLRTLEAIVYDEEAREYVRIESPAVSGAAMRATLREHAMRDYLAIVGAQTVSRDRLRLLFKGGRNDSGGQSVNLDAIRRLRSLCPALSVFGAMDGGYPIPGKLRVQPVQVYSEDTVAAGVVSPVVRQLTVAEDGTSGPGEGVELFGARPPLPPEMARTRLQQYRHDMGASTVVGLLPAAEREAGEDRAAARKAKGGAAKKAERREANESMPYAFQAITPGTPMVSVLRLIDATEVEAATLLRAVALWKASGGHLGGGASAGRGACRVEVKGWRADGARPGTYMPSSTALEPTTTEAEDPLTRVLREHLEPQLEEIIEWLGEDK